MNNDLYIAFRRIKTHAISVNLFQPFWIGVFIIIFSMLQQNAGAQEYLRIYTSAPTVMQSNVTGGTVITESFESFSNIPNFSWASLPNGYTSPIGTYTQTVEPSYIQNDNEYATGTGKYMAIQNGGVVKLVFDNPVRYFALACGSIDENNIVKILRDGQVIGTFVSVDILALLPKNINNNITAINGTQYSTYDFYGKPNTSLNIDEPYAFLHYIASEGMAFDEIVLTQGGGEFENDSHTLLIGTPVPQGDWVELISTETPSAVDDTENGNIGQAVEIDVLDNDVPGDAPIDPSTVQISGTATAGESLVVTGEGTWSVNTSTGAITFTPESGFSANPSPIEYSVMDDDNFASNLATVTVIYPFGPTAVDDNAVTTTNLPININILANDTEGSTSIDPASITFISSTEPNPSTEGLFTVNGTTGLVTFTPVIDFMGTVTINYSVCDQNILCDVATITVSVEAVTSNLFPSSGFGTLAFEDLWPAKGDSDFNDLVIDYQFLVITNTSNYVESVQGTFIIRAIGASFKNGFGFQLASAINPSDLTVTGYSLKENIITLDGNGTESGQSVPTIIVFDNAFQEMIHPGGGTGINTSENAPFVTPDTLVINIDFVPNTYTYNQLDISSFNPFIFVNLNRSLEVHLPDYPPTALANQSLFGTLHDDTNPGEGRYYKSANNLSWAINTYESFDYPIEKQQIVEAYLKFAAWATSSGTTFEDWYKDLPGYRNSSKIYTPPLK